MFIKRIFAIAFACALVVSPSFGAQITRSYHAVMHVRDAHAKPVLNRPDHVVGIGAFRGLAIFKDGAVAVHRYQGWFDLTNGSGKFHGYALWRYEDGSELRAAYDGSARKSNSNEFQVKARFHHFEGTGRYAGVSGEGSFEGKRFEPIDKGGSTLLNGVLILTMPK
jgi:hypothetical protein